jgi:hypothetical protein
VKKLVEILKVMRDDRVLHVMLTLLPAGVPPRKKLAAIADVILRELK